MDSHLLSEDVKCATERRAGLWRAAHEFLFTQASNPTLSDQPAYLCSGPGLAYHGAELEPELGIAGYKAVSHVDSLSIGMESLKLAAEQVKRGVVDANESAIVFLRGMTLYRMGRQSEAVEVLRRVAALAEESREVAVAQHLVGNWDCLRSHGRDPMVAQHLLAASHKNAAKRGDEQHLAHVKHSMALCILKTTPTHRPRALELLRQSLALTRSCGDEWGEAKVLHSLGQALSKEGAGAPEARRVLLRSLEIGKKLGYARHVRSVQESIARLDSGGADRGGARRPPRSDKRG